VSFNFRQLCSSGITAALLVVLANCTDAPTATSPIAPSDPTLARASSQADDAVVPGQVIVGLHDDADAPAVAQTHGVGLGRAGYGAKFRVMTVANGTERAMAARLAADPRVAFAEPNYIRHVDTIDSRLWAFYNDGTLSMSFFNDPNGRTGLLPASYQPKADADEDNVEGYAANGADVMIGSIDTGVDFSHPEFTGRLIAGCDWYSMAAAGNSSGTCSDFTPDDTPDEGHGTHTTGTMAGSTVGVAGVAGAASHVKVLVQRVCGSAGCYTSSIVNALYAAADYLDANKQHLVAVNMSLGGNSESTAEKNAIAYATKQGVLVIASAGNSGSGKVACPACDANAISVASTTWADALAPYSQYGSGLDISAPGGSCYSNSTPEGCIFSAVVSGYTGGTTYSGPQAGGSYTYMQGTSMAAPQVTGTAAIVASKAGLRGSALRSRILGTADDLGTVGYDTKFGNGRLNSYRAVTNTSLPAGQ
jgi:serine protease